MENSLIKMFTHIRNGLIAKRPVIFQKRKKGCESFLTVLWNEGFILGYTCCKNNPNILKIFLKYYKNRSVIKSIKLITKPSHRIYYSSKQLFKINSIEGLLILSTTRGVMSLSECKKQKIGGEAYVIIT